MIRLHINVDHVATVRQARRTDEPDPVRAAVLAELGGADGITVHLREDRRHIPDRDVRLLASTVRTTLNLELAASGPILELAEELRPQEATLVPEKREEITTEGGLALGDAGVRKGLAEALRRLRDADVPASLFIGPDADDLAAAADLGAEAVELHTGEYANAWPARMRAGEGDRWRAERQRLAAAAARGRELGLRVHAGHGLTYENVGPVAAIAEIEELNIGHSVVSRAVLVGMERAVREMRALVREARP
jgi:pyridoxine 5-phosphate synthase